MRPDARVAELLADREAMLPVVAPFMEPGELLQVVVRARGQRPLGAWLAMTYVWPFMSDKSRYLLVATDRAWLVLEGRQRWRGPFRLRYRGARDVHIEMAWLSKFEGFDQPYVLDPTWQDYAHAANDALDAMRNGRPWDLAEAGDRLAAQPRDAATDALGGAVKALGRFVPKRPEWLRRLRG